MKLPHATKLAIAILFALISRLPAAEVTIDIKSFSIPSETIKDMGFDWLLFPLKTPVNPMNPEIEPFDPNRPIRGSLLPNQLAVVERSFKGRGIEASNVLFRSVTVPAELEVPGPNANPAFSFAIQPEPDNKLSIRIIGSGPASLPVPIPQHGGSFPMSPGNAQLAPGTTLVLSFAGKETDTVTAYFITATP